MDINNDNRKDPHASESETKHPVESGAANVASHTPKLKKKKGKKKIVILSIVLAIAIIITAVGVAACSVITHYMNRIGRTDGNSIDIVPPEDEVFEFEGFETVPDDMSEEDLPEDVRVLQPEDIEWSDIEALNDDDLINILLIGNDYRDGYYARRSDSIILCSINPELGRIVIISLMRDMYLQIPGYSDNILNASFNFGGIPLLEETITKNFGVSIDGSVEVGLDQFMNVIDTVGGVDIYITEAEAAAIGSAESGTVHMDGNLAKKYASLRRIDSDFSRTERQRKVISAIYTKAKSQSLSQLLDLADELLPSLITNMSNTEILRLLIKCYPLIGSTELEQYRLPPDGGYERAVIRGLFVLVPDLDKCREALNTYLPLE